MLGTPGRRPYEVNGTKVGFLVYQCREIVSVDQRRVVSGDRVLVRIVIPTAVGDHAIVWRQSLHVLRPCSVVALPAVEKYQRIASSLLDVVKLDAINDKSLRIDRLRIRQDAAQQ